MWSLSLALALSESLILGGVSLAIHRISFKTLTPLWSGNVGRDSFQVRETGLIGSLRQWYEGIVRGMHGQVCDITAKDSGRRCTFERQQGETFNDAYNRLCIVCRLFGCTGWRGRFRLDIEGLEPQELYFVASRWVYTAAGNWLWRMFGEDETGGKREKQGKDSKFKFGVKALWGDNATLNIVPLSEDTQGVLARVVFLLSVIEHWGALGAKTQLGFGQVQITDGIQNDLVKRGRDLITGEIRQDGRQQPETPDSFNLDSFFSHIYHLPEITGYMGGLRDIGDRPPSFAKGVPFVPCAFDIRYKSRSRNPSTRSGSDFGMRPWFKNKWGSQVAHRLFGRSDAQTDEDRSAGCIHVSHLYQKDGSWNLKVWGHVPSDLNDEGGVVIPVADVAKQTTAFVQTMFPGSKLHEEFKRQSILG